MKKDTYYFSHDYNAHNDTKILYMRQDLGMEGYGMYWFLVEALADSGGILPLRILPVLAKQMDVSLAKVETIVNSYELFQIVDDQFFSQRLMQHLELRNGLSEAGRIGASKRWNNDKNGVAIRGAIGEGNAKEKKGKEKKGKETKDINKSNLFRQPKIPLIEDVKFAFNQSGGTNEMAEMFFNKHDATGWFINNSPIVNFKSLIPNFISNFKKINNEQHSKPNSKAGKKLTSDERFEFYRNYASQFSDGSDEKQTD